MWLLLYYCPYPYLICFMDATLDSEQSESLEPEWRSSLKSVYRHRPDVSLKQCRIKKKKNSYDFCGGTNKKSGYLFVGHFVPGEDRMIQARVKGVVAEGGHGAQDEGSLALNLFHMTHSHGCLDSLFLSVRWSLSRFLWGGGGAQWWQGPGLVIHQGL